MVSSSSALFSPLPKGNISNIIVQRITDSLISGELKPGDKLPTEIEFSEQLGVGRNAVREAIKVLEAFGVVEIRRSEGTFIVDSINQNLLNPTIYGLIMADKGMDDLLEFKITFLNAVLFLAVPKATNEDIEVLQAYYEQFCAAMAQENGITTEERYQPSHEFYNYLAVITNNPLIIELNKIVLKISRFSRVKAIESSLAAGKPNYLPDIYKRLLDVVISRDKNNVGPVIEYTLTQWRELLHQ